MNNSKATKRSLTASILSVVLCLLLLIGATFAWFTDSVSSGSNRIVAGNLDIELEYTTDFSQWNTVESATDLFKAGTLWEPGHTEVVYLKISNKGSLALEYELGMSIISETAATNVNGGPFKLSDYLMYGTVEGQNSAFSDRTAAIDAVTDAKPLSAYSDEETLEPGQEKYVAIVVYMPESVGNEANYRGNAPDIDLGISVAARQTPHENDSFGNTYDENAMYDRGDGTYSDGDKLYVNVNGQYVPVTEDAETAGLYTGQDGTDYVAGEAAVKKVFAQASDGEKIVFIDDVTVSSVGTDTYITAENVTIDLNEHTVYVDYGTNGNSFSVTGDGSVVKNGTFRCTGSRTDYPLWITGNIGRAKMTVEDVTVYGGMQVTGTCEATLKNVTVVANTWYDVYVAQDSRVTVESGSFTSTGSMPHFYFFNYGSSYNPTVTINGGEFSGGIPTYGVGFSNHQYTFTNNLA